MTDALAERRAAMIADDESRAEEDLLSLVVRLRRGERSALAEVYDRHHESVRRFSRRLVGDTPSAEDLVHDTFLALPKAIRRFEGRSSLPTFIKAVALNLCKQHIRAAQRYRRAQERYAMQPAPPNGRADERHERSEAASVLLRALDELPLDQRIAFVLCVVEERTSAEAAAMIGVGEGTVRTRVHRAKTRLKERLQANEVAR